MADNKAGPPGQFEARQSAVERELEEIELLTRQARTETDRHAARRDAAAERVRQLMDEGAVAPELREAQEQLMLQYQRSALMSAQIEVLEGKQKVLERLHESLAEAIAALAGVDGGPGPADRQDADHAAVWGAASAGGAIPAGPVGSGRPTPPGGQARAVLTAQEEMRRAIARQMHDGPAQSIANIALQAEVVQRLMGRDPPAAQRELGELRAMVQNALEATKTFIFEVRPMVLDDLGLVPTLRRASGEHQRRAGLPVRFESAGADRRLDPEVETQLFRIVDDALAGLLARRPSELSLRLNWTDQQLAVVLRSRPPATDEAAVPAGPASAGAPTALADMIRDQHADDTAREDARRWTYGLPAETLAGLEQRARTVGIALSESDGGLRIEAIVQAAIGTT